MHLGPDHDTISATTTDSIRSAPTQPMPSPTAEFMPLSIAVLTVSDTRDTARDTSGRYLTDALQDAGHRLYDKQILKDNPYQVRALVAAWIAEPEVQVVLVTGGTGFRNRDATPEAIAPLLDQRVDGFGELFRHHSMADIGSSTIQSRALAGVANHTLVVAMPGSTGACQTAWESILREQLDARHRPCNFVEVLAVG